MKQGKLKDLPKDYAPGFMRRMDKRMDVTQRLIATYNGVVSDQGGYKVLSHVRLRVIERFCFLVEMIERLEHEIASNPKVSDELVARWVQASNALLGAAKTIGLEKSKVAGQSLKAYIEQRA